MSSDLILNEANRIEDEDDGNGTGIIDRNTSRQTEFVPLHKSSAEDASMNQKTGTKGEQKTGEWRHYAPRFLSKGFTEDGTRGGKIVCFEKERSPRETRTKSWGAEYGFEDRKHSGP